MASPAWAANDMFLKLGTIQGESVDKTHAGEIEVLAWSWGMSNVFTVVGGGGGAGKVSFRDFTLTKYLDKATPKLMLATASGQHIAQAVLTVRRSGVTPFEWLKITFTDVVVTSVSTGGSTGETRLTENISLAFTKVLVEYTLQKPDGGVGEKVSFNWDIATNTGS